MSERPQVVLLNPDLAEATSWERALGNSAKVRVVHDERGLSLALASQPADVLVAPCDAGLLEVVQRWRTYARLVLCGSTLPEGVLDEWGEGAQAVPGVEQPEGARRRTGHGAIPLRATACRGYRSVKPALTVPGTSCYGQCA